MILFWAILGYLISNTSKSVLRARIHFISVVTISGLLWHGEVDSEASNEVFDGKGEGSHVTDQQQYLSLTYYLVKLIFKDDVEYDYDRCVVIVVVKHGGNFVPTYLAFKISVKKALLNSS